jgi:isopentenyldiphosphate isomerase
MIFFSIIDKDISGFTIQKDELERIKWISREELSKEIVVNPDFFTPSMDRLLSIT